VQQELSRNKRLASEIVQGLLSANFLETIHQHAKGGIVRNNCINKIQGANLRDGVASYCPVENHLYLLASKNNPV
jgi:hypothetical protein